jgi:hypothetical protein
MTSRARLGLRDRVLLRPIRGTVPNLGAIDALPNILLLLFFIFEYLTEEFIYPAVFKTRLGPRFLVRSSIARLAVKVSRQLFELMRKLRPNCVCRFLDLFSRQENIGG